MAFTLVRRKNVWIFEVLESKEAFYSNSATTTYSRFNYGDEKRLNKETKVMRRSRIIPASVFDKEAAEDLQAVGRGGRRPTEKFFYWNDMEFEEKVNPTNE
ncbi:hypothetical protein [Pelagicoccus sp. SDUM812003]|uniref:hypothetical protein n=1 Tax=Pelagicoccus sp. SDUM812003 TaxID=3041267 RepID=UPI00280DDE49|nr:hypothetical protein [Pelagicoccus sp. SDUM812003]MDQ8203968.1 hypothetical protein [Pelagicoccus sp. SDUM812003]